MKTTASLALASLLVALPAMGQQPDRTGDEQRREQAAPDPGDFDATVAARVLEFGHAEEAYAKLAAERAVSEPIRGFARSMMDDHARFNAALVRFAGASDRLREEDQAVLERLRTLNGAAFEQVYIRDRAQERMRHYNLVSKLAAQASDPELRRAASEMLPVLGRQLEQAQALREDVRPIDQGPVGAVPGQSEPPAGTVSGAPQRASPPAHAPGN